MTSTISKTPREIKPITWPRTTDGLGAGLVGGLDNVLESIRRALTSRILPEETVESLGITHVRGILFYGPNGCGKTATARAVSRICSGRDARIVYCRELVQAGATDAALAGVFAASDCEPEEFRVVLLDDVSAFGDPQSTKRLLSAIDVAPPGVFIIARSENLASVAPALLRPGRLEIQLNFPLPDEPARRAILAVHAKANVFK